MREEYGESTGKTGSVIVFVSVLFFFGVWDLSFVQIQKQSCLN
jgi:hypothetical protein